MLTDGSQKSRKTNRLVLGIYPRRYSRNCTATSGRLVLIITPMTGMELVIEYAPDSESFSEDVSLIPTGTGFSILDGSVFGMMKSLLYLSAITAYLLDASKLPVLM